MHQILVIMKTMNPKSQKTDKEMEPARGIEPPTYGLRILFADALERSPNHLQTHQRTKKAAM